MSFQQTATDSFKVELAQGIHNFGPTSPDTFKIALYTANADLNALTTAYTAAGEVSGGGYVAGGEVLIISVTPTQQNGVAYWSFSNASWPGATFTARGALIYNASKGDRAVAVLDFGADKTGAGAFVVQFPAADFSSAILRISGGA